MTPIPIKMAGHPSKLYLLEQDAELVHTPGFLSVDEKGALWLESKGYPWEHQTVRSVRSLRANAWFAEDPRSVYIYSGQRWNPAPFAPALAALRDRLTDALHERMNSALATLYSNGA